MLCNACTLRSHLPDSSLVGQLGFPIIQTVLLTGVRLTETECTKFDIRTTGSPVNEESG
jgi:hypothetical protein